MRDGACVLGGANASDLAMAVQAGEIPVLGEVWVELGEHGELVRLFLPGLDTRQPKVPAGARKLDANIKSALKRYVNGVPDDLQALALAPASTPFAGEVRCAMQQLPWGAVATYGQIAKTIGKPGASRAVGRACATNPLPVVVPCHRVVARHGPGGFGLGPKAKRILLGIEGFNIDALG